MRSDPVHRVDPKTYTHTPPTASAQPGQFDAVGSLFVSAAIQRIPCYDAPMNVSDAIAQRISCRSYACAPVSEEAIHAILEAGRLAPSACNKQPWRFAVVTAAAARTQIVETAFLKGIPMKWALDAPVFFVLGMVRSTTTHKLAPLLSGVDYPWVDVGIAGEHMVLQATELGLGTCWIGWIRQKKLARIIGWPRAIQPVAIITCGYSSDNTDHPRHPRRELHEITTYVS